MKMCVVVGALAGAVALIVSFAAADSPLQPVPAPHEAAVATVAPVARLSNELASELSDELSDGFSMETSLEIDLSRGEHEPEGFLGRMAAFLGLVEEDQPFK